jgi:hypothetical protein
MKFYSLSSAPYSMVRIGQQIAADFLATGDAVGARMAIEQHVLPVIEHARLADLMVDVRAQYAVILARTGDGEKARSLMRTLEAYDVNAEMRAHLRRQSELIETIAQARHQRKIGRNDPCPCGSGKKFKKCHGRA